MSSILERVADWAGREVFLLNNAGEIVGEGTVSSFSPYINLDWEIVKRENSYNGERIRGFTFMPNELTTATYFSNTPEVELKLGFAFDLLGEPVYRRNDWSDAHREFTIISKYIYNLKNKKPEVEE